MKRYVVFAMFFLLAALQSIWAEEWVTFNYQGRVHVTGRPFTGTGYFKFAIIEPEEDTSLWSNDLTSEYGDEPASSVMIAVTRGVFQVMIGSPELGMEPLHSTIFNSTSDLYLRVWFSDGERGFQQMTPDRRIANARLYGILSEKKDFTIYVDGEIGNDRFSGLRPNAPKKTIQGAVNVLPSRLNCNATIRVAPGVYREQVVIYGIDTYPGKYLFLEGDPDWVPGNVQEPNVRITGLDSDTTTTRVREFCLTTRRCTGLIVRGLLFDNALKGGVCLQEGMYFIQRCLSRNHGNHDFASGFRVEFNCQTFMTKCLALQSGWYGFWAYGNSTVEFTDCSAKQNNLGGISCGTLSAGNFYGTGDYSDNMLTGIRAIHNSRLWFANTYSGKIYNNKSCGMELNWDSYSENHARNSFSGNLGGSVCTYNNSHTY